jgi:hypothetical protein
LAIRLFQHTFESVEVEVYIVVHPDNPIRRLCGLHHGLLSYRHAFGPVGGAVTFNH